MTQYVDFIFTFMWKHVLFWWGGLAVRHGVVVNFFSNEGLIENNHIHILNLFVKTLQNKKENVKLIVRYMLHLSGEWYTSCIISILWYGDQIGGEVSLTLPQP